MTICITMKEPLEKRLRQKKSIDQIGQELCPGVKDSRDKALRLIIRFKGKQYLKDHADWLGYDVSQIHNPKGNGGRKKIRQLSDKEKRVERAKNLMKIHGIEPDLYDVQELLNGGITWNENLDDLQEMFPGIKPRRKYPEYSIDILIQIPYLEYQSLLDIIYICIEQVRKRCVNGWQDIEDIIESQLQLDKDVWKYEPMEIYVTPRE